MILSDTAPQGRYIITNFNKTDIRRFLDLGLARGAEITRLFDSPFGDPIAFFINGSVIALRRVDSDYIEVVPCEEYD